MKINDLVNSAVIVVLNGIVEKDNLDNAEKRAVKYAINVLRELSEDMPREEGLSHWQIY
jgi:hypothetical protein